MKIIPRASGFNHVLSQGDQLWNIESIAKEYVIENANYKNMFIQIIICRNFGG